MWIARDKSGCINGFYFKPVRTKLKQLFWTVDERWINKAFEPIWTNIPEDYLTSLDIEVPNWDDEPVEIKVNKVK